MKETQRANYWRELWENKLPAALLFFFWGAPVWSQLPVASDVIAGSAKTLLCGSICAVISRERLLGDWLQEEYGDYPDLFSMLFSVPRDTSPLSSSPKPATETPRSYPNLQS